MDTDTQPALVGETEFEEAYPQLLGYCRNLTFSHINATHDAQDLAQTTFAKGWERRHQFKRKSKLSTWLIQIAHNLYISDRRCKQLQWNQRTSSLHDDSCLPHDHPANFLDSDTLLMAQQARDTIAKFQPHYLTTLDLALQGFNYPEIADELGTISATIKSRMHRIHTFLRDNYANRARE